MLAHIPEELFLFDMMISILIANYNNEMFLYDCLKSISNQKTGLGEYEVIICDDGSSDNSLGVIQGFKEIEKFKILNNDVNKGVGYTKSRLVEESTGEWFVFLDSDDKLSLDFLNEFNRIIQHFPDDDVSIVYANSIQLLENGELNQWKRSRNFEGSLLEKKFDYPIFHPILYNRNLYNKTEGIDIGLKSAEDYDLWYKMEEVGRIIFYDKPLYYYRMNINGLSQTRNNIGKWTQVMLEHAYCSAIAARRRGLDSRLELNSFADVIITRLSKYYNSTSRIERILTRLKTIFFGHA